MTMPETNPLMMRRAIELSRQGFPAPNPRVGCVIVKDGRVIGEGYHDHAGGPHAEIVALNSATEDPAGSYVYVTLEPCSHHGRTPPCSRALIEANVAKVTYAVADPNERASGGAEQLAHAGIEVEQGVEEHEARLVNRVFLHAMQARRPFVTVKAAVTADGFMARLDGSSKWITGEAARAEGHRLRAEMGAVLVGWRTAKVDQPQLTARIPGVVNQPIPVVIDPENSLDPSCALLQRPETVRFARLAGSRENDRVAAGANGEFDLRNAIRQLFEMGVIGVLVEGGPTTIDRFLAEELVDEIHIFQAKLVFNEGLPGPTPEKILKNFPNFRLMATRQWGEDAQTQWAKENEV